MNQAVHGGDGRRARHEGRRAELLVTVTDAVLAGGWTNASLRALADAAGVSHRTLLHHFASRHALLVEVLALVREREQQRVRQYGHALRPGDVEGALALLDEVWRRVSAPEQLRVVRLGLEVAFTVDRAEPRGARGAEDAREGDHGGDHGGVAWFASGAAERWVGVIAGALRVAAPHVPDPHALATVVYATVRGLQLDLLSAGEAVRVHAAYLRLRDLVATALEEGAARDRAVPGSGSLDGGSLDGGSLDGGSRDDDERDAAGRSDSDRRA